MLFKTEDVQESNPFLLKPSWKKVLYPTHHCPPHPLSPLPVVYFLIYAGFGCQHSTKGPQTKKKKNAFKKKTWGKAVVIHTKILFVFPQNSIFFYFTWGQTHTITIPEECPPHLNVSFFWKQKKFPSNNGQFCDILCLTVQCFVLAKSGMPSVILW